MGYIFKKGGYAECVQIRIVFIFDTLRNGKSGKLITNKYMINCYISVKTMCEIKIKVDNSCDL